MTHVQNSPAVDTASTNVVKLRPRSPYVGVNWFKESNKWRAYVRVPGTKRTLRNGRWCRPQRFVYVGVYDNVHVAALAREDKINSTPGLERATHNVVDNKLARIEYANMTRDPDASPFTIYKHQHVYWYDFPGMVHSYQFSSNGRVRLLRPTGYLEVVVKNGRVVIEHEGRVHAFSLDRLLRDADVDNRHLH